MAKSTRAYTIKGIKQIHQQKFIDDFNEARSGPDSN